ncbi:MAG: 16S rRNA (adenine(1518)-N(6)/adenine(1519)-N(6))-dimethyltransferase RsmA [Candidatus Hydrogenedentales bacterium]
MKRVSARSRLIVRSGAGLVDRVSCTAASSSTGIDAMSLADVQQRYGITFKKSLGQNLLLDENINRIMVDAAALGPDDAVIEVGAGLGALTRRLAERAGRVLAVEIDRAFMPCLEDQFAENDSVKLFRGDILNHDLDKLLDEFIPGAAHYKMVSNLPYYITTPVLFHFWESGVEIERMVVMVQAEVGERMVAPVGSAEYGVLTLAAHYYADVDLVHHVPRACFRPKPNVDSVIMRLRSRAIPAFPDVTREDLFKVTRAAFTRRRKTLRNALQGAGALGATLAQLDEAFAAAGIDSARRPQTLTLAEFAELTRQLKRAAGGTANLRGGPET